MDKTKTFTELALRTESRPEALKNLSKEETFRLLKLMFQAGEVIDCAKRAIFYGKPLDGERYNSALWALNETVEDIAYDKEIHFPRPPEYQDVNLRLLHAAMGIFGEAGELAEALGKQMTTGELDLVNVSEELGDVDWYKQIGHDETGVSEADVRAKIIAKLQKRYPDKFDADAALNRDVAAERVVLETTTA